MNKKKSSVNIKPNSNYIPSLLAIVLSLIIGFIIWQPALKNNLTNYDERAYITENKSLRDFSDNFLQLGTNYHYKRISNEYNNLSCKIWWQFWKNQPETKNEDKCSRLGTIINKLEEDHIQSNLIWRKLYDSPNLWFQIREWWFGTKWWIIRIGSISFLIIVGWSMHTKFISTRNKNKSPNPQIDPKDKSIHSYYIDYRNRK
jgi:hypothetical protein